MDPVVVQLFSPVGRVRLDIPRNLIGRICISYMYIEVGIYKRKQESKKARKQELDQKSDQEKKKVFFLFLGRFRGHNI